MELNEYRDKVAGALYGFCIGDAMGATTEFMNASQIKNEYGRVVDIIGGGWLGLKPGQVTDDSQMMFRVVDALRDVGVGCDVETFKHAVARKFEGWLATDPPDVGNTCRAGINVYTMSHHQHFMKRDDDLLGNGGLMRFLPLALLNMLEWNLAQNDVTHPSEGSARAIQRAQEAVQECLIGNIPSDLPNALQRPLGTCGNTLNNALYFQSCRTFGEAIVTAVNMGGDSDTIAAITGGIYGSRVGLEYITMKHGRWVCQLDLAVRKMIGFTTGTICEVAQKVHQEWFTSDHR